MIRINYRPEEINKFEVVNEYILFDGGEKTFVENSLKNFKTFEEAKGYAEKHKCEFKLCEEYNESVE